MAMFLSSILSEFTSRSISFLIDKCLTSISPPTVEETLSNLQRLLCRVHIIVDEADERHISNHAMMRQLSQLRKEMYRGYHTLDTFRCRGVHEEENRVSPSFTPSNFNPAKRIRFSSSDSSSSEQGHLLEVLGCLEAAIRDTSELVLFLSGYPRRCRQPYSMYLLLDKCMFGRQMEMEQILGFLLQEEAPIDGNLGVLPIVGRRRVGKSTLIEHACNNERVRTHFCRIMCFRRCGTKDERTVATLSDCDVIKHGSGAIGDERILVIIELVGDMDEDVWRKFYSDCKHHVAGGSKIIVASRSEKISRFGTTQPLEVKLLTPEEHWYFFKVRTFGSTDLADHPKLASIAMDMARETNRDFFCASVVSALLKANFDAHFWSMALASVKKIKRINPLLYREEKGADFLQGFKPINVRIVNKTSVENLVILHDYETGFVRETAQNEGSQMTIRDLLFGSNNVRPRGRFEVVACRSHIPPNYSYMWECEVRRPQRMISRRKRTQQIQS
ncbi:disease resistance protein RGA2 [Sorghum bicolor]|jgi:hypothetical protein|uniref:NB-ARC domain-containing protein n=1 Tax=Sorghum bicolor TaxID=4558 RepID=C5X1Z7_SORBI|nr:disease resistance protein RGA2 [Sorghum bicolor]EER96119.1 hypothetical protein SORBI_3002G088500 [Sorghum bicolor]|eukprot:XP_002459598.1 disease resistance protein RGA2 [Sorghum bicolor]